MGTERFPKWLREKVDADILGLAAAGNGDHKTIVNQIRDRFLMNCGNVMKFFTVVAGSYASTRKQALQKEGKIVIGANGVAKLPEDMSEADRHAFFARRCTMAVGDIYGLALQAHHYGNIDLRDRCRASLKAIDSSAAVRLDMELELI